MHWNFFSFIRDVYSKNAWLQNFLFIIYSKYQFYLLDDAFKLTIDKIFPANDENQKNEVKEKLEPLKTVYHIKGKQDHENLW